MRADGLLDAEVLLTSMPELEIPFALADQWDQMLKTKGHCATYWEIAKWGYEQRRAEERDSQDQ